MNTRKISYGTLRVSKLDAVLVWIGYRVSKGCKLRGVALLRRETIDLAMQHGSSGGGGSWLEGRGEMSG